MYFLFSFLVLTHRYGRDGRDSKKFEDKAVIFDFTFLQSIVDRSFVGDYMLALNSFVLRLNENPKAGKGRLSIFETIIIIIIREALLYVILTFFKRPPIRVLSRMLKHFSFVSLIQRIQP